MIVYNVLSILKKTMEDEDLIYHVLSFLNMIIERNSAFIKIYKEEGIIDIVIKFLNNSSFSDNINLIKIMIKLLEDPSTTFDDVVQFDVIHSVNALVQKASEENSNLTDLSISLLYNLLLKIVDYQKSKPKFESTEYKNFVNKIIDVGENFRFAINSLNTADQVKK